jgi:hypothetical protein
MDDPAGPRRVREYDRCGADRRRLPCNWMWRRHLRDCTAVDPNVAGLVNTDGHAIGSVTAGEAPSTAVHSAHADG